MKVCVETLTNKLIDSCSTSDLDTLKNNALIYGYLEENFTVKEITYDEFQTLLNLQITDSTISTEISPETPTFYQALKQKLFGGA